MAKQRNVQAAAGAALAIVSVIGVWIFWAMLFSSLKDRGYEENKISELGIWGDSFGGLTSLFTAFGFLAVVAGFRLQRQQIRDGQEEQHRQRFDNWYFELLKLLREARDAVKFRHSLAYQEAKSGSSPRRLANLEPSSQSNLSQTTSPRVSILRKIAIQSRPQLRGIEAFQAAWLEARHFLESDKKN